MHSSLWRPFGAGVGGIFIDPIAGRNCVSMAQPDDGSQAVTPPQRVSGREPEAGLCQGRRV